MKTRHAVLTLAVLGTLAATGCGGSDHQVTQRPSTTTATSTTVAMQGVPGGDDASLRAARPTHRAESLLFQPTLHFMLPAHWTANDLDRGVIILQVGDDEERSPGAVAFDGGLERRSPAAALAALQRAKHLHAGPVRTYRVGSVRAKGFEVPPSSHPPTFQPSGFHPLPTDRLRTMVVRLHGKTVTVFVTANSRHFDAFASAAERVLRTVR